MTEKKSSSSLPIIIGGAAVLGVAALDGGVLSVAAFAALGAGAYYITDKALQSALEGQVGEPDNNLVKNFAMTRRLVAGCCGVATFLNPMIGIPGTAMVCIGWYAYQGHMDHLIRQKKAERESAANG